MELHYERTVRMNNLYVLFEYCISKLHKQVFENVTNKYGVCKFTSFLTYVCTNAKTHNQPIEQGRAFGNQMVSSKSILFTVKYYQNICC